MINPLYFAIWFWSSTFEAMQLATSEMMVVRPPAKLVLIRGGRKS